MYHREYFELPASMFKDLHEKRYQVLKFCWGISWDLSSTLYRESFSNLYLDYAFNGNMVLNRIKNESKSFKRYVVMYLFDPFFGSS